MSVAPPQISEPPEDSPPSITGFPAWIKAAAAVVSLLLIVSLVRMVPVLHDAISVERAHRYIAADRNTQAIAVLQPVVARYPDSTDLVLDLAQAQLAVEDYPGAAESMEKLNGRKVSAEQEQKANAISDALDKAYERLKEGKQ